jgi:hypothetical protein
VQIKTEVESLAKPRSTPVSVDAAGGDAHRKHLVRKELATTAKMRMWQKKAKKGG